MASPASPSGNALLVVAKQPAAGRTKTRLTPPLAPAEAAALYECFLQDTLDLVRRVPGVQPAIAFLPAEAQPYFARLAPDFDLVLQRGEDLGARLDHALGHYLAAGYQRVAIMNSDGPTLPEACLHEAFAGLSDGADVVLGPSDDGGYYLIGLRRPAPRLLREVRMSTPYVLADTLALAAEEGLRVHLLPTWYDVDDADSLARLQEELATAPQHVAPYTRAMLERLLVRAQDGSRASLLGSGRPSSQSFVRPSQQGSARRGEWRSRHDGANLSVAVVIPALNEAGNIRSLVQEVRRTVPAQVLVVDNGSTDDTAREAGLGGAQVIREPRRGYGYACAAGVARAAELGIDIVVFLDGDHSFLPAEMPRLLVPLLWGQADMVLGSRWLGHIVPGAMPPQQRFGNWLAAWLIRLLYRLPLTDLGPYRAVRLSLLLDLRLEEMTYGWPTEMIVKAAALQAGDHGARIVEVPVSFHSRRSGKSKVSGTLRGTILAARYILGVTLRYGLAARFGRAMRGDRT